MRLESGVGGGYSRTCDICGVVQEENSPCYKFGEEIEGKYEPIFLDFDVNFCQKCFDKYNEAEKIIKHTQCPYCKSEKSFEITKKQNDLIGKTKIELVFPNIPKKYHEYLVSGTCNKCLDLKTYNSLPTDIPQQLKPLSEKTVDEIKHILNKNIEYAKRGLRFNVYWTDKCGDDRVSKEINYGEEVHRFLRTNLYLEILLKKMDGKEITYPKTEEELGRFENRNTVLNIRRNCEICNSNETYPMRTFTFKKLNYDNILEHFPSATPNQQERFRTGICKTCWENLYDSAENDNHL